MGCAFCSLRVANMFGILQYAPLHEWIEIQVLQLYSFMGIARWPRQAHLS